MGPKLSRLKEIDRIEKILRLAADPARERPEEAQSAARLAADLLRDYQITAVVPKGAPIKLMRVRDALQGMTARGVPTLRDCPREMRFAPGALVHPKSIALGQFCFFTGDYYLFVATRDVTLE